jgi:YVTN family beta-propeller protein
MNQMLSRRNLLAAGLAATAGCGPKRGVGFPGFAFVANYEGEAVAAVDLTAFAVAKHIPVGGRPVAVIAHPARPSVYVLTPASGAVHEISSARLAFVRKLALRGQPVSMRLAGDNRALWIACRQPNVLVRVQLNTFRVEAQIPLGAEPFELDLCQREPRAAVSFGRHGAVAIIDLVTQKTECVIQAGRELSLACFQSDGKQLLMGNLRDRRISIHSVPEGRLVTHLPCAVRPENFCFKSDGGQLFVTGQGMDAVVIVYPYRTEIAETVLAGHTPGAMAACTTPDYDYLFVANSESGDVTVIDVASHKVLGMVSVGKEPGAIAITPDNQYALVLNRVSGDMAVIRIPALTRRRARALPLFTMIPVGSRPVSVAVQSV